VATGAGGRAFQDRIFRSLGRAPFWITFSGGEPFLRADLPDICRSAYEHCRPGIINIPTNGLLGERIVSAVARICQSCPRTSIVINLSLDHVGEEHDRIRGVPGNFQRAVATYHALRKLAAPNLTLGIHTVISVFNVADFPRLYRELMELRPDSYITEIAEERVELDTVGTGITPTAEQYAQAIGFLLEEMRRKTPGASPVARIAQAFRREYYRLVVRWLQEQTQIIPCYAGFASAQIAPQGDVWTCCVRAEPIGNLREADYDFRRVWFSPRAEALRRSIRARECHCPLANAAYTNMLHHPPTLLRVVAHWLGLQ